CLQADTPFGVCLIVKGNVVGAAAEHEAVGCLAKIADWEMEQLGLLQIRARGAERFSINDRRVQSNGLIRADATLIPPDPEEPIEGKLGECAILLRRIVQDLVEKQPNALNRMIGEPYRYESSSWVSNRLCEFLPIPMSAKQKLMELPDPVTRLEIVHQYLQHHRVL
ncbi:MAG: LON peptidase substrate-binding domain-containing protein, partial [Quisquiliibacterium sp.]